MWCREKDAGSQTALGGALDCTAAFDEIVEMEIV
jgi:hypothetical protein